jgi:hypothetical protein
MLVFYSEKAEASIRVIDELNKKGKKTEPVCIDDPQNRPYLKKYGILKVPTIIDLDTKTKIEGKSCFVYISNIHSVISGYGTDVSDNFSGPSEQYNIYTPADGSIDKIQQSTFIIPNEGLLGNKITSTTEETVLTANTDSQRKMQELMAEREENF